MGLPLSVTKHAAYVSESCTCTQLPPTEVDNAARSSVSNSFSPIQNQFLTGRVIRIEQEAHHLKRVFIEVPNLIAQSYLYPGQYLQIRAKPDPLQDKESKASYFAILSPPTCNISANTSNNYDPNTTHLTFLIKETPSNAFLFQLSTIDISLAMGKGFLSSSMGAISPSIRVNSSCQLPDLLLVATGTGIAPIASFITSMLLSHHRSLSFRRITLLLGVRSPAHIPLVDTLISWCATHHIRVVLVFSRPLSPVSSDHDDVSSTEQQLEQQTIQVGSTVFPCVYGRYVQDVLQEQWTSLWTPHCISSSPRHSSDTAAAGDTTTRVLVCGQPEMALSVKDVCLARGVAPDQVSSNVPITVRQAP